MNPRVHTGGFAEQEYADLFVKEVGGRADKPGRKRRWHVILKKRELMAPQVSVGTMLRCFVHCCCSRSARE